MNGKWNNARWFNMGHSLSKPLEKIFEIEMIGKENLPEEPSVLVMNHCIGVDGSLVAYSMKKQLGRYTHFFVDAGAKNPFARFVWPYVGQIFVNPQTLNNATAFEETQKYLSNPGHDLGIFAEGPTKDLEKREVREGLQEDRFYQGASYIAKRLKKPIVPIGLSCPEQDFEKLFIFHKVFWKNVFY